MGSMKGIMMILASDSSTLPSPTWSLRYTVGLLWFYFYFVGSSEWINGRVGLKSEQHSFIHSFRSYIAQKREWISFLYHTIYQLLPQLITPTPIIIIIITSSPREKNHLISSLFFT